MNGSRPATSGSLACTERPMADRDEAVIHILPDWGANCA